MLPWDLFLCLSILTYLEAKDCEDIYSLTFDEQEYYHINNSKIFKEIEIEKYGMKELKNDWENFKEFCEINGGKRGIED